MPLFLGAGTSVASLLRATGVNELQLSAAFRKLQAAFRQFHGTPPTPPHIPPEALQGHNEVQLSAAFRKLQAAFRQI